jgi:hypothetical protein
LRSFSGGTAAWRDLEVANVLASPNVMHAVGVTRRADAVSYRFETPDRRRIDLEFKAVAASPDNPTWHSLPLPEKAPWAWQEPGRTLRWRDAPELEAIVVQLRANVDSPEQSIAAFLEEVEASRARLGRPNVVLDMRFNSGGNLLLTRKFMERWPARVAPPGAFFVLTSRRTFSAGIASIAYLKQAGGDRVVLVGEEAGDRLIFFSDGRPIQLPHSGLFFLPAIARMDYQTGCRAYDDCFVAVAQPGRPAIAPLIKAKLDIERIPVAVQSLAPDVVAPWTIESWLDGTDPAIEAIASREK